MEFPANTKPHPENLTPFAYLIIQLESDFSLTNRTAQRYGGHLMVTRMGDLGSNPGGCSQVISAELFLIFLFILGLFSEGGRIFWLN